MVEAVWEHQLPRSRRPHGDHTSGASFVSVTQQFNTTTSMGVRRDKAALSSGCEAHPAIRSSRKQPEQAWRRRNV
jgi:hypothetical protein